MRAIKLLVVTLLVVFCSNPAFAKNDLDQQKQATATLQQIKNQVSSFFNKLSSNLKQESLKLSSLGVSGKAVDRTLDSIYLAHPNVISVSVVNNQGIITAAKPDKYQSVGADISKQAHVIKALQTHKPVFSTAFISVEGPWAVTLHYPIFNQQHDFIGTVALLFLPQYLLDNAIKKIGKKPMYDILAMQTDGRIVYSDNQNEIGRPFPISSILNRITQEKTGSATYQINDKKSGTMITKKITWTTITLYDIEWRLSVAWKA